MIWARRASKPWRPSGLEHASTLESIVVARFSHLQSLSWPEFDSLGRSQPAGRVTVVDTCAQRLHIYYHYGHRSQKTILIMVRKAGLIPESSCIWTLLVDKPMARLHTLRQYVIGVFCWSGCLDLRLVRFGVSLRFSCEAPPPKP